MIRIILAQREDGRLNLGMNNKKGVHPDFQRLWSGDVELNDDSTLEECGVNESSNFPKETREPAACDAGPAQG